MPVLNDDNSLAMPSPSGGTDDIQEVSSKSATSTDESTARKEFGVAIFNRIEKIIESPRFYIGTPVDMHTFACRGMQEIPNPWIKIKEFGSLGFPINPKLLECLFTHYRHKPEYGTLQISPHDFTFENNQMWGSFVTAHAIQAARTLGVRNTGLNIKLHKLIVVPKGATLSMYTDEETEDEKSGLFATMLCALPSPNEGTELVQDCGGFSVLDDEDGDSCRCVTFHTDGHYKFDETTSGYYVALVYNLYSTSENAIPIFDMNHFAIGTAADELVSKLKEWVEISTLQTPQNSPSAWKFVFQFVHLHDRFGQHFHECARSAEIHCRLSELLKAIMKTHELPIHVNTHRDDANFTLFTRGPIEAPTAYSLHKFSANFYHVSEEEMDNHKPMDGVEFVSRGILQQTANDEDNESESHELELYDDNFIVLHLTLKESDHEKQDEQAASDPVPKRRRIVEA